MNFLMLFIFGISAASAFAGAWIHYSSDGDLTRDKPAALLLLGALVGLYVSMGSLGWTLPSQETVMAHLTPLLTR